MLLIINCGLVGDNAATIPVITYIAKELQHTDEKLYVINTNMEVMHLAPDKHLYTILSELGHIGVVQNLDNTAIVVLSGSKAWEAGQAHGLHMMQSHFKYLKLVVPTMPFNVELDFDRNADVPAYDFIVSPYSRSNHMNNKLWPLDRWQIVIDRLKEQGKSIAVLGHSSCDSKEEFKNVEYIFDKPLKEVCSYIYKVKDAVLSIDAGPSHLVHMIRKPHLLLYPACLSDKWVTNTNKNAVVIRDWPLNITVDRVWDAIKAHFL